MRPRKLMGRPPRAAHHFNALLPTISTEHVHSYHTDTLRFQFYAPSGPVYSITVYSRLTYTIHNDTELYSVDRIVELPTELQPVLQRKFVICGRHATLNTNDYTFAREYAENPEIRSIVCSLLTPA